MKSKRKTLAALVRAQPSLEEKMLVAAYGKKVSYLVEMAHGFADMVNLREIVPPEEFEKMLRRFQRGLIEEFFRVLVERDSSTLRELADYLEGEFKPHVEDPLRATILFIQSQLFPADWRGQTLDDWMKDLDSLGVSVLNRDVVRRTIKECGAPLISKPFLRNSDRLVPENTTSKARIPASKS